MGRSTKIEFNYGTWNENITLLKNYFGKGDKIMGTQFLAFLVKNAQGIEKIDLLKFCA